MKRHLLLFVGVLLFAACTTQKKYAYYFDHYDYNSGKKNAQVEASEQARLTLPSPEMSPLQLDQQALSASAGSRIKPVEAGPVVTNITEEQATLLAEKYSSLSKAEKREFRREVKAVVKEVVKAKKEGKSLESVAATKAMDRDLKMALIFAVVAIVLGAFSGAGSVFWILSIISLVVAIVFFIQWVARQ